MDPETDTATTGDGLTGAGETWVKRVQDEIAYIQSDGSQYVGTRRAENDDIRLCRWDGQSKDGRKHTANLDGKPPFPFDGGCDVRLRSADTIVNELLDVVVEASVRAGHAPAFTGVEASDQERAQRMATVHRWVLKQMRNCYRPALERCAQYCFGDSPAVGVLGVFWQREVNMVSTTMSATEVAEFIGRILAQQGKTAQPEEILQQLTSEDRTEETAALLTGLFQDLEPKRIGKMVEELQGGGACHFPQPHLAVNRPVIRAYRVFEDIFFRGNLVEDIQRSDIVICREIMTKAEVQGTAAAERWSVDFVNGLVGVPGDPNQQGQAGRTAFVENMVSMEASEGLTLTPEDRLKGKYEVLRVFLRTANEDGIPGLYQLTMNAGLEIPAKDMELLEYQHGQQPFVVFAREYLRSNVLDARGVPELDGSTQSLEKLSCDAYGDHVQMCTFPPVKKSARRAGMAFTLKPGAEITVTKHDDISWMEKSEYPRENEVFRKDLRRTRDEYFGRLHAEADPTLVTTRRQALVNRWLDRLILVHTQIVQLWQQFLTDADLARIAGPGGLQVARTVSEIQGQYDLELSFDVRDLDPEYTAKKMEVIGRYVLPLDTDAELDRPRLKRWALASISPQLADMVLPAETARTREISQTENDWVKALAGIPPQMQDGGQAFGLRLQVWRELMAKNAQELQVKEPRIQDIVRTYAEHLAFQTTQQENATIGRLGVRPVE